ncbi:hypothetical protein AOQ84DRAFT_442407 [Glonium stellatum]|uniref:RBR-type E3 ubiquitin transferase n=1 Tax=Glonium stellatum TaxID=574774 RepID=A0A8E2ESS5_9PEZI|nr:hypothetical protein AOQ84DRAFT_442407 [Glonium stellatum]
MGQEHSRPPQTPPPPESPPSDYSPPSPESDEFILDLVLEASRLASKYVPACHFYAKGHCNRGDHCAFRHDKEPSTSESVQSSQDSSKPLCRYYVKGNCNRGSSCLFRHDDASRPNGQESSVKRGAPCRFFLKGRCNKGESCPFQHDNTIKAQDTPQNSNKKPSSFSRKLGGADIEFAAGATVSSLTFGDPSAARNSEAAHNSLQMSSVSCQWNRAQKKVWIYYGQSDTACRAAAALNGAEFHGTRIKAVYEGVTVCRDPKSTLTLVHTTLLENVNQSLSYRELKDYCSGRTVHPKHIVFGDLSYEVREARSIITKTLEKCGPVLDFHVNTTRDMSKVTAIARFEQPEDAQRAVKELNGTNITELGNSPFYITPVFAVRFTLRQDLYSAIAKDLKDLISKLSAANDVEIVAYNTDAQSTGPPSLRIHGKDAQSVARAKSSLESILAGTICVNGNNTTGAKLLWDPFFARYEGIIWLRDRMSQLGVFIYADARRGQLRFYGDQDMKEIANIMLAQKCQELETARQKHKIGLDERLFRAALSGGVKRAEEILGAERVELEITPTAKFLTISGSEQDARAIREILQSEYGADRNTFISGQSSQGNTGQNLMTQKDSEKVDEDACAVCWTEPSIPYKTHCNHLYCADCFDNQVNAAITGINKSLPLVCCHDSCGRAFGLDELRNALSSDRFEALMKASFESYVKSQPQNFRYCPTPDCDQIYRVTSAHKNTDAKTSRNFYCPSCLTAVCTSCHFLSHVGYSCAEYEKLKKDAERDAQQFAAWKKDHDARDCPKCGSTIEKNEGCNHMECVGCKAHICWFCMMVFVSGSECYAHMSDSHDWNY